MTFKSLVLVGGLFLAALPVYATPVTANGSYHEFLFGATGSFATSCGGGCTPTTNPLAEQTGVPPYTFTGAATVFVLDLFLQGDEFTLYDNGSVIGNTSIVANTAAGTCGGDIACSLADVGYSRGSFALGAGSHSITVQTLRNAVGTSGGAAVLSVSAPPTVPEPGTELLTMTGVAAIGMLRMRMKARAARRNNA